MKHTAKANRKGERKGRKALFFPKWHTFMKSTTTHPAKRHQRKITAISKGILK